MVTVEDGHAVVSFGDRTDTRAWAFAFARLCGLLERILPEDLAIGKLDATMDLVKEAVAENYHMTGQQFQSVLNLLYPPLSGTSDRSTEAPEG